MDFWVAEFWELETRELDWVKIWEARSYSLGFLTSADFEEVEVLFRSPDLLDFLLLSPPSRVCRGVNKATMTDAPSRQVQVTSPTSYFEEGAVTNDSNVC